MNVVWYFHSWLHQTDPQLALSVLQCVLTCSLLIAWEVSQQIPLIIIFIHIQRNSTSGHTDSRICGARDLSKYLKSFPICQDILHNASCLNSFSYFLLSRYIIKNGCSISSKFLVFSLCGPRMLSSFDMAQLFHCHYTIFSGFFRILPMKITHQWTQQRQLPFEERLKWLWLLLRRTRGDTTEFYKIIRAVDKLNVELLFAQPHNMRTVKCPVRPAQECFKVDKRQQFWGWECQTRWTTGVTQ